MIYGGAGDELDGGSGIDRLWLSLGGAAAGMTLDTSSILTGGAMPGGGSIQNFEALDYLRGSEFADHLTIATQANLLTVDGGGGDDVITAGGASVTALGGSGADIFVSGVAADSFDGGAGVDTVAFSGARSLYTVSVDVGGVTTVSGPDGQDVLTAVERLQFSDTSVGLLVGQPFFAADTLTGAARDDIIYGLGGDDVLVGGGGRNLLDGGAGIDTVSYAWAASGVTVDLALSSLQNTGGGSVDTLVGIEGVIGSAASDFITAPGAPLGGMTAQAPAILAGGGGDDVLAIQGAGADPYLYMRLDGGAGDDTLSFVGAPTGASYPSGSVQLIGGDGIDVISSYFVRFSSIDAGAGDDVVVVDGLAYTYAITLGAGSDVLSVDARSLAESTQITVLDFQPGVGGDQIDLSSYLSTFSNYTPGSDPFESGHAILLQVGADTQVLLDRDGAAGPDYRRQVMLLKNVRVEQLDLANVYGSNPAKLANLGTTGADVMTARPGGQTLYGRWGDDTLSGTAGADVLNGGAGSDLLNGGAGVDTAAYASVRRAYTLGPDGTTLSGGPEGGTDTLVGVERLKFIDGYVSTDASAGSTAGAVYRLYQTMLNRTPDANGLAFWAQQIDAKGSNLKAVAIGFIGSPEFSNTYGALNNTQFVELMYANVLHRPSDSGRQTWLDLLNNGGSRADVAIGFSESQENVGNLSSAIQKGIWVGDLNAGIAARFYDTVFSRLPDAGGLDTWTKQLNAGASLQTVANGFVASTEFQTTYGALNNDAFIELMYHNVLGRGSDAPGKATWMNLLNSGGTRADVVVGFSESAEHVRLLAPHIDDGVWAV